MELQFKGGNCFIVSLKQTKAVIDPLGFSPEMKIDKKATLLIGTQKNLIPEASDIFLISGPGEYEVGGLSVNGFAARAHMDEEGKKTATIYKLMNSEGSILISGHIHPSLTDDDLEKIGMVDVLVVPVGGNGYTLDATGAAALVRAIEPKIVIPAHYSAPGVKYDVPQAELDLFLKELGITEHQKEAKFKFKGDLPEKMQLIELEVQ